MKELKDKRFAQSVNGNKKEGEEQKDQYDTFEQIQPNVTVDQELKNLQAILTEYKIKDLQQRLEDLGKRDNDRKRKLEEDPELKFNLEKYLEEAISDQQFELDERLKDE